VVITATYILVCVRQFLFCSYDRETNCIRLVNRNMAQYRKKFRKIMRVVESWLSNDTPDISHAEDTDYVRLPVTNNEVSVSECIVTSESSSRHSESCCSNECDASEQDITDQEPVSSSESDVELLDADANSLHSDLAK
jgi:hypothetical protein